MRSLLTLTILFLATNLFSQSPRFVYPIVDNKDLNEVTFSPDNKYILSRTDELINLWDLKSGKLVYTFSISMLSNFAFTRDGQSVIYLYSGKIITLELKTGIKKIIELGVDKKNNFYPKLMLSPSQKYIAVGNSYYLDSIILLFSIANKEPVRSFKGKIGYVVFSVDEKYLISGKSNSKWTSTPKMSIRTSADEKIKIIHIDDDSLIRVYNNISGGKLDSIKINKEKYFNSSVFDISPDGQFFSWGDEQINVYSTPKKATRVYFTNSVKTLEVLLTPDNKYFLTNNHDLAILWDAFTAKPVATMRSRRDGIECAFNDEGTRLMTWDGRDLDLWTIPEGKKIAAINNNRREPILKPFNSKDGKKIGLVSYEEISIWKDSFQKTVSIIKKTFERMVTNSPVFNTTGNYFVTANYDSAVLYLADSGTILKSFKRNTSDSQYIHVYISFDDAYLMTHNATHTQATVWEIQSGKKLFILNKMNPQFTRNPNYIIAGQTLYDVTSGKELKNADDLTVTYPLLNPVATRYSTKYNNEDIIEKRIFEIKDNITGHTYSMLVMSDNNYLVFDADGHFDGTPGARDLLSLACGSTLLDPKVGLDKLWVPGLAEKIMKGEPIMAKKLVELKLCDK